MGEEKGATGAVGTAHQALTTSSMMGSGLAASSCSFTFSSTRGCKTTTEACSRGPATWGTLNWCSTAPLATSQCPTLPQGPLALSPSLQPQCWS